MFWSSVSTPTSLSEPKATLRRRVSAFCMSVCLTAWATGGFLLLILILQQMCVQLLFYMSPFCPFCQCVCVCVSVLVFSLCPTYCVSSVCAYARLACLKKSACVCAQLFWQSGQLPPHLLPQREY